MRRAALPFLLSAALVLALAPGRGEAATTVLGEGPALACFEAARDGDAGLKALRTCDGALAGHDLGARDRAATFVNRGVIHLRRRDAASALADFDRAVALRPDLGEAHANRGAALIVTGDSRSAIVSINRGLDLGVEDPHEAYFNRAIAAEQLDDMRAAYTDYRRAAALKPDWPLPARELARFTVTTAK